LNAEMKKPRRLRPGLWNFWAQRPETYSARTVFGVNPLKRLLPSGRV
jgi:hypothetical protein